MTTLFRALVFTFAVCVGVLERQGVTYEAYVPSFVAVLEMLRTRIAETDDELDSLTHWKILTSKREGRPEAAFDSEIPAVLVGRLFRRFAFALGRRLGRALGGSFHTFLFGGLGLFLFLASRRVDRHDRRIAIMHEVDE